MLIYHVQSVGKPSYYSLLFFFHSSQNEALSKENDEFRFIIFSEGLCDKDSETMERFYCS